MVVMGRNARGRGSIADTESGGRAHQRHKAHEGVSVFISSCHYPHAVGLPGLQLELVLAPTRPLTPSLHLR